MAGIAKGADSEPANKLPLIQTATSLAVSLAICKAGHYVTKYYGIQGGILPAVTAIVVILATVFPRQFAYLAPTGEAMAMILMQARNILVFSNVGLVGGCLTRTDFFLANRYFLQSWEQAGIYGV